MKTVFYALITIFQASESHRQALYFVDQVNYTGPVAAQNAANGREDANHMAPRVDASFRAHCPAVEMTDDRKTARFVLEIRQEEHAARLTNTAGELIFTSRAKTLRGMTKDVCGFIGGHGQVTSGALPSQ